MGWSDLRFFKDSAAFIFKGQYVLEESPLGSTETVVSAYPVMQCNITKEQNALLYWCKISELSYVVMLVCAVFVSGVEYISEVSLTAEVVLLVIWYG